MRIVFYKKKSILSRCHVLGLFLIFLDPSVLAITIFKKKTVHNKIDNLEKSGKYLFVYFKRLNISNDCITVEKQLLSYPGRL